ncbi:MAG: hypothetical protein JO319_04395 [Acidobacteriaceae bacterium]|nr:hypothetical protein [Acidobacteriaceae bacterium]
MLMFQDCLLISEIPDWVNLLVGSPKPNAEPAAQRIELDFADDEGDEEPIH